MTSEHAALLLRMFGHGCTAIGKLFGKSPNAIRHWTDEAYRQRRRERMGYQPKEPSMPKPKKPKIIRLACDKEIKLPPEPKGKHGVAKNHARTQRSRVTTGIPLPKVHRVASEANVERLEQRPIRVPGVVPDCEDARREAASAKGSVRPMKPVTLPRLACLEKELSA